MIDPLSSQRPTLAAIIMAARAGSLAHANEMFTGGGFAGLTDDPDALAVKGRLLKDQGLRAKLSERPSLFLAAAKAYGASYQRRPQPYTRINEASLLLLAGQRDEATAIASSLLTDMASGAPIAETPYYIKATRAEAQLICGALADAKSGLAAAFACDPDGWADHASTLRQFGLLLDALHADKAWLDGFRPPASLSFAGHLAIAASQSHTLRRELDSFLDDTPIGFGYGALAAGADIIIAEALLARDIELHVILPTGIDTFIAQSVTPYEPEWRGRFDACLERAMTVQCVTSVSGAYEPLATKLAADVAMGAAVLNARQLETKAAQLLIIDDGDGPYGTGAATAYLGERWTADAQQHLVVMPRSTPVIASGMQTGREGRADRQLYALLMIDLMGLENIDDGDFALRIDTLIRPLDAAARAFAIQPDLALSYGNNRILAFETPEAAWDYAVALQQAATAARTLRLAAHYAVVHQLDTPLALTGRGITELTMIAAAALPGVTTVSETLAATLAINSAETIWAEHIGEAGAIKLYALSPREPA